MNRPRIFLSTVSQELRSARQSVTATLTTLGYDSISQDNFSTGHGELKEWLREQIDSCEGVVQIAGHAYGAEPSEPDAEFGRISYTQYEFLYAQKTGKKTWIIIAGDASQRDLPIDQLDLPRDPNHPDPKGYQAERFKLQKGYIAKLKSENHLRYTINNATELELTIRKLQDELKILWQKSESQQRRLISTIVTVLIAVVALGCGGLYVYQRMQKDVEVTQKEIKQTQEEVKKAAVIDTKKIRAHLLKTIEETHARELKEADQEKDWKKRKELRDVAEVAHKGRMERVEELAKSFEEIEGRGESSTVFQEMGRILTEQGVDQAIEYIASQRQTILQNVKSRAAAQHEKNQKELQPLLQAASLYAQKGDTAESRKLFEEILAIEPEWKDALTQYYWLSLDEVNDARYRKSIKDAESLHENTMQIAKRLKKIDANDTDIRFILASAHETAGDLKSAQGDWRAAANSYYEMGQIAIKLNEKEPWNVEAQRLFCIGFGKIGKSAIAIGKVSTAEEAFESSNKILIRLNSLPEKNMLWQEDLSQSYSDVGRLALLLEKIDVAEKAFLADHELLKGLASKDQAEVRWQNLLSASFIDLGDLELEKGKPDAAKKHFEQSLELRKQFVELDKENQYLQADLAEAHAKLGKATLALKETKASVEHYEKSLAILQPLADKDKENLEMQQDLSDLYIQLGDLMFTGQMPKDAGGFYLRSHTIIGEILNTPKSNVNWVRDSYTVLMKLADCAEEMKLPKDAETMNRQALERLETIEKGDFDLIPHDKKSLTLLRKKLKLDESTK